VPDACRGAITTIAAADVQTSVQFDATSQSSSASPAASGGVAGELDCCWDKYTAVGMHLHSQYNLRQHMGASAVTPLVAAAITAA